MATGTLVFVEHDGGNIKKTAYELLGKARELGGPVSALLIGSADAGDLGAHGASTVYTVTGDPFGTYTTGAWTKAVCAAIAQVQPAAVLAPASSAGRDLFPRVAARLGLGMAAEVTVLNADGTAQRPAYAGKALQNIQVNTATAIYTVRPNSFAVGAAPGGSADVVAIDAGVTDADILAKVIEVKASDSTIADLTEADRIVSGGRSLKSAENFDAVIRPLAASIGATPGASRAAVDAGYAPHSAQVGQTGKVVNPTLYVACGISGAIQHLAGMRTSKVIVAVNKDAEAPIFQHATYGLVEDLFEVCPLLQSAFTEALAD